MSACCSCSTKQVPQAAHCSENPERVGEWMRMVFAALVAGQSMIFGLAVSMTPPEGGARVAIHSALALSALAVFFLVGLPLFRSAWRALLQGRIVIEQLFLAGIFGAFFASLYCSLTGIGHVYYEVVAILLAIYCFGQLIAEKRRAAAIEAARELGTEFATCEKLLCDGSTQLVPVETIRAGDVVRVAAGAPVPVDGVVVQGVAFVRESALTGESFPVVRRVGDEVRAGSHCLDHGLEIRATAAGTGRVLDGLLRMVRGAQAQRSALQREADRLVAWFLPSVLLVAALTFAVWTWAAGWERGLFNALAVLVVACPCSMGLATPIGIWAALGALARRGVVARSGDVVEVFGKATTVVFDKTGTLGEERLELVDFVCAAGENRLRLLDAVAAIEAGSNHPVAMGFRRAGCGMAKDVTAIPGVGVRGSWHGEEFEIGNAGLLENCQSAEAEELRNQVLADRAGSHEVWVLRNGKLAGLGILRERLKESASDAVNQLRAMGIRCVVMTGDRAAAAAVHGFEETEAELSPTDKARRVQELQRAGEVVVFVGDGVNDAPAMAVADGSVAVGAASALAQQTATALLATNDLRALPAAIARCRRTLRAIRRNLLWAAAYNVVGIALAAGGVIHPVMAALLMLFSSLTVTWQALRGTQEDEEPEHATKRAQTFPAKRRARAWAIVPQQAIRLPSWSVAALGLGIFFQGPLIVWLGGFRGLTAPGICLVFLAASLLFFALFSRRRVTPGAGMAATMFSFGGLLMLIGWWMDAGFAPVVRDGVCLCGCADSGMGWGIFLQPNWMAGGMLLAAIPMVFFESARGMLQRTACWLAGIVGMFVGMELSALCMALVPVSLTNAGAHFFATYSAMVIGMSLGMFAACSIWKVFVRDVKEAAV